MNNLFEEKYRVYAFDSSLFAGVVAGVYAKPRLVWPERHVPLRRALIARQACARWSMARAGTVFVAN